MINKCQEKECNKPVYHDNLCQEHFSLSIQHMIVKQGLCCFCQSECNPLSQSCKCYKNFIYK